MPDIAPSLASACPAPTRCANAGPSRQDLPETALRVLLRTAQIFAIAPGGLRWGGDDPWSPAQRAPQPLRRPV